MTQGSGSVPKHVPGKRTEDASAGDLSSLHGVQQARIWVSAALVWLDKERLLMQRRALTAKHGAGQWELIGGKIERGESSRAALLRELREEWGNSTQELRIGGVADILHHCYPAPDPEVHLIVFHVDGRAWGEERWKRALQPMPGVVVQAFERAQLPLAQCLAADRPFLAEVSCMKYPFEE